MKVNVTDQLISWLREREQKGYETYGGPLTTFNGRNSVQDALEEILDYAQYVYQWKLEREALLAENADLKNRIGELQDQLMSALRTP